MYIHRSISLRRRIHREEGREKEGKTYRLETAGSKHCSEKLLSPRRINSWRNPDIVTLILKGLNLTIFLFFLETGDFITRFKKLCLIHTLTFVFFLKGRVDFPVKSIRGRMNYGICNIICGLQFMPIANIS